MSLVVAVGVFVFLTLCGALITKLFDDPLTWLLARILGGLAPRKDPGIRGTWRSVYDYSNPDGRHTVEQTVQLRQFGPYVVGKAVASTGPHRHRIRGRFQDRTLTGTWENVAEGARHNGSFQLLLRPDGAVMTGKWVGFDRRNRIQHGDWRWELLTRSLDDAPASVQPAGRP